MRLICRVLVCLAALAALAATPGAAAQPASGTITGTITGDGGNRLAGVAVTVQNQLTGARHTATTNAQGRYEIVGLPVEGEYQVSVQLAGFATAGSENVALVPNATLVVNFRLKLTLTESVAVSAPTPPREAPVSSVEQTVNEQLAHALPLVERNFIPLATLTAGFTGNPNHPSPHGQMYWTNNVIVDGASHFSKWRSAARTFYSGYGLESIKEVRVLNRFPAEYGESLASVTTAVTKAGTNQLRGSALFFYQDDWLRATPVFAQTNPPADSERYGATLGGPLVKDRTHFFASYEGWRARNQNIVVSPDPEVSGAFAPDNEDEHLVFFRADHRASDRHLAAARYNAQFFRWHHEPGGLSLPGTGTGYTNDVHTVLVSDRFKVSTRVLNELRAQFARYVDVRTDLRPTVFVSRSGYSQEGGTLGPFGFGADPEDTWEASDIVTSQLGAHVLKAGGGAKYVRAHNASLTYGRGAYYFAGAPDAYPQPYLFIQALAPTPESAHADPRSRSAFAFVQDDWRMRHGVTLNLGIRYDVESVYNVTNYSAGVDANNVQPRIGAAWEPVPGGRTLVRGGFGVYTQQHLLYYINRAQLEGPGGAVTISLAPESPLFPTYPNVFTSLPPPALTPPRDIQRADASFRNPYALQATFGAERIFGRLTLSADYIWLDGRDLMSLVDANAPASNQKPDQRTVAEADATRPLPVVAGAYRNIVTLGNLGRSWYHALQVKADRSTGRLQTIASYTFARADDMANYQLPEDSRDIEAEKARADADVRHNVTIGFTWQLPGSGVALRDWAVSGIGMFRSNRPYTISWGDDRNGTTQNDARPDGRNTGRTDTYHAVDLALARRFSKGSTVIEGRVEVFNVFNATNYDEYIGTLLSPWYGQPVTAFPSRRVQLAAIVRF